MSTVRETIDQNNPTRATVGQIDSAVVDAATEPQIEKQQLGDD
ncbi:MAG: hypothetical protein OXG15_03940 [Gammaproteobacteria bacterium]|nr:hypothetical protein [Gammaproteobacteria bacterium]